MNKYIKVILIVFIFLAGTFAFCLPPESNSETNPKTTEQLDKLTPQHDSLPVEERVILGKDDEFKESATKHEAEAYVTFLPSTKSKDNKSRIQIIESEFDYSYEYKLFDKIPVTLSLSSEYIDIKENSQLNLPSHLTGLSVGCDVVLPFFNLDKTYINLGVSPSIYRDDWSFKTSSFRMPTDIFLIYKPNDKLIFVGGLAYFPDFKDQFFPAVGFVYKPNEKWIFNITTDDPSIAYMPNDRLTIFTQMELPLGAEYEVKRGDSENMVLIYNDMRLGLGVGYKINKFVSVSLAGGGVFDRYIKYRKVEEKLSIENGGYVKFSVDIQI
ncbi:MAG: DUF6268 family outer membrane beta-barrel protein [Candidatus Omnitrophica bacterium]|jgi:hypothetical protein|nr:DUF6268 family outer membrane beta-barrel protein [Candidatus Omnitrophota bacterium]